MKFETRNLGNRELQQLYTSLLLPRLIDEKMINLIRLGRISKWFSGRGQEAIAVGSTLALDKDEFIFPLARNLGVFTARDISLRKLFAQFEGKPAGFTNGRDRTFHFGTFKHHIVGMISHLGPQLAVASGVALYQKIHKRHKCALTYSGDGGTSEGDFHEALNLAAVWDLPVIFLVENNGYGLSTPSSHQFKCKSIADKGVGYGIESVSIDGNNILEVYNTVKHYAEIIRKKPRPILIEARTFRMRGHEEASGTKYVPQELFDEWEKLDPVIRFEEFLISKKIISFESTQKTRAELKKHIDDEWQIAEGFEKVDPSATHEINSVYAPSVKPYLPAKEMNVVNQKFIQAISNALFIAMEKHPELVLIGEDIAEYGGAFKVTQGLVDKFGKDRVRNTPICESAPTGVAMGYALVGGKAVIEMQFADFVTMAFNQIVNNLAKTYYRWGASVNVTIRMPSGAGVGAGPFHSQTNEQWFFHVPGLKLVYPSNPFDAKGLLLASIEDPNPVLFFEHKALYRSKQSSVPEGYYTLEIGKAITVLAGSDVTVITYGMGVEWAIDCVNDFPEFSIEIIDLRTLLPWDKEAVKKSVKKTGKVLILHEDNLTGGIGGEIAAWLAEHCFEFLDAPIKRTASLDTPIPFAIELEQEYLPVKRLKDDLRKLLEY